MPRSASPAGSGTVVSDGAAVLHVIGLDATAKRVDELDLGNSAGIAATEESIFGCLATERAVCHGWRHDRAYGGDAVRAERRKGHTGEERTVGPHQPGVCRQRAKDAGVERESHARAEVEPTVARETAAVDAAIVSVHGVVECRPESD